MRNQWLRLLLLRTRASSEPQIYQVHRVRTFASSLHHRAPHVIPKPFALIRRLSSSPELAVESTKALSDQGVILVDVFGNPEKSNEEIEQDLAAKNVVIDHDLILSVLRHPDTSPDVAKRVLVSVLENHSEKWSSKSYNLMLEILGENGFVKESWVVIESLKKKGYDVSKDAYNKLLERFEKDGLSDDVEKLKELYASGSDSCKKNDETGQIEVESIIVRISEIIQCEVWDDDVEKQLHNLGMEFSSDLVASVLESLEMEPNKALIFFRWVEESGLFRHDQRTYNVMARVLSKEDQCQKFWRVVNEMRSKGYEMERDTYLTISQQFVKRKMVKEAVDSYEFAMLGENKPSVRDCTLILKKVVISEELDMDLFLKVVRAFKANGDELTDNQLKAIIKSLISVGRMAECNKILAAMKEAGYQPSASLRSKIAFLLSSGGETEAALEFMDNTVCSQYTSDHGTWSSLVKGYCANCDLDEASNSIRKMVEKEGASRTGHAVELLVGTHCQNNNPLDAYKFVVEMVNDNDVRPWCATYKTLTSKLLAENHFNEALDVMRMMKNQGYPPDLVSFVDYLSRTGSADDALTFSLAMTSKRFPSTSVFIRLFEAYFKAGRQTVAQEFLSRCPKFIKNHADILNLFSSQKSGSTETTSSAAV